MYFRKKIKLNLGSYSALDKLRKLVSEEKYDKHKNVNLNSNKIFDYYGDFNNLTFSVEELNIYENSIKYSFGIKGKFKDYSNGSELIYYYDFFWIFKNLKRNISSYLYLLCLLLITYYFIPEKFQFNNNLAAMFLLFFGVFVYFLLTLFIGREKNSIERFTEFLYDVFQGHVK